MSVYLLPCGCGTDIAVTAAQAGGRVKCSSCGVEVEVPKFRDLTKLKVSSAPVPNRSGGGPRRWTALHTMLLAGGLLAAACGLASMSFEPPKVALLDAKTLMESVKQAPIDEVYAVWRTRMELTGIDRPPTEQEAKSRARSDFYTTLQSGLRWAAAIGGAVSMIGGLGVLASRRGEGR